MRRTLVVILAILFSLTLSAATRRRAAGRAPAGAVVVYDDFRNGQLGWEGGFADYSPQNEGMELEWAIRPLPPELGIDGTGFRVTSNNHSDDVFCFIAKKLTARDGVKPNQRYDITFSITIASNAGGQQCGGIGGHPGYSVYLKAGATGKQPRVDLDSDQYYRINVDKGNQAEGGTEMSVAGHVSTESDDCRAEASFVTLYRPHHHPFPVMSNEAGEIWLIVGTDSGFEGRQTLYYQSIGAILTPVP